MEVKFELTLNTDRGLSEDEILEVLDVIANRIRGIRMIPSRANEVGKTRMPKSLVGVINKSFGFRHIKPIEVGDTQEQNNLLVK